MELRCQAQNYEWGKLGKSSMVANLLASADNNFVVEEHTPYAELWMGTHPNGPALLIERDLHLSKYLESNEDAVGPDVKKQFGVAIPFLLKVLSIRKALSIQAHPNKAHAERLHSEFPELYRDGNHKPELAVALTPFEALCGFRPLSEIQYFITNIPELKAVLSPDAVAQVLSAESGDKSLKPLFTSLMTCDKSTVARNLDSLLKRLADEDVEHQNALLYEVLRALHGDFPADVGCFSLYLLNYLRLRPGQAVYLGPNMPHAYLSGDCIECMACSDNVVRAGLTPKHIDVPTLVEMLDYGSRPCGELLFHPTMEDEFSCVWRPPVPDFAVVKIVVPVGSEPYNTRMRPSPSILIVISGSGSAQDTEAVAVKPGTVLFLKSCRQLTLTVDESSTQELVVYQALCNVGL